MDAPSAPPSATPHADPPAYVYAAAEYTPRSGRDADLCRQASHTDWLYIAGTVVLDAGAIVLDTQVFRFQPQPGVRLIGPSLMGLTWGATLGGAYLSLASCDPEYVRWAPPEGNVRTVLPALGAVALASVATAPFVARIEQGPIRDEWPVWERSLTVIFPMITGFGGTFLPLLFPPRTYRAAEELRNLRIGVDKGAMTFGYGFAF